MRYDAGEPRPPERARPHMDKGTASVIAYSLWWVSGIVMLFVGRDDRDVRFHAAQSTIVFGSLTIAQLVLSRIANALTGTWLAVLVQVIIWGVVLFWITAWAYCLFLAWRSRGSRFDVPLLGDYVTPYADRLADATS